MSTESVTELKERIKAILDGIDREENASDFSDGWWETSTGAAFGAKKLAEVLAAIDSLAEVS